MSKLGSRLSKFIESTNMSVRSFEKRVGLSNGLIGNVIKKGASIGTDKLERILETFPDLNPEWLVTGQGEMLKIPRVIHEPIEKYNTRECEKCQILEQQLTICKEEKDRLMSMVESLLNKNRP